jgi:hypothetical protein
MATKIEVNTLGDIEKLIKTDPRKRGLIGDKFYFEGDWRTLEGPYEIVEFHDHPATYDCRHIQTGILEEGFWASVVESKL